MNSLDADQTSKLPGETLFENLPLFQFLIIGIGVSLVSLIGIIGNILTGIVLVHSRKRSVLYNLLIGLGVWDTLLLGSTLGLFSMNYFLKYLSIGSGYRDFIHPRIFPYMYGIRSTAHFGTAYFTIGITIERFLAVSYPLKVHYICSEKRTLLFALLLTILTIGYNLPRWFDWVSVPISNPNNNLNETIRYKVVSTDWRLQPNYFKWYLVWGPILMIYLIPFLILIVLNSIIFAKVSQMQRKRKNLTASQQLNSSSVQKSLTIMIIGIVSIFLILTIFVLFITAWDTIVQAYYTKLSIPFELTGYFWAIEKLLTVINSSTNPIFYCIFGKNFRHEFVEFYGIRKMLGRAVSWSSGIFDSSTSSKVTTTSSSVELEVD